MIVIDATQTLLGRLASYAAKQAMLGEEIVIVNCSEVMISGTRDQLFARYKQRADRGTHSTGPFFPRLPELIVKRTIRGMVPYKQPKGRAAFARVRCFRGLPPKYEKGKLQTLEKKASDLPTLKAVKLADISRFLGAKI